MLLIMILWWIGGLILYDGHVEKVINIFVKGLLPILAINYY